jgi:hypothetical protein
MRREEWLSWFFACGLRVALGILTVEAALSVAVAQQPEDCTIESSQLLKCAGDMIRQLKEPTASAMRADRLKKALETLASKGRYDGAQSDLDELKRVSTVLKAGNRETNYEAILLLDNAIASHAGEIRPALSPETLLAKKPAAGRDIQADFVRQKLDFLKSAKAEFYDNGPFELVRRSLLAGALEDSAFLKRKAGEKNGDALREQLKVIDDLIARYRSPKGADLLHRQGRNEKAEIYNNVFWRAIVLFLLGDIEGMRTTLRELALDNLDFGLDTLRQVYIYRVFNEPYSIIAVGSSDHREASGLEVTDRNLVKRFYNAAQLALLVCSRALSANVTDKAIDDLKAAIKTLEFHDYFVVVAQGSEASDLSQANEILKQSMNKDWIEQQDNSINQMVTSFAKDMDAGARNCAIDDTARKRIYSPFVFAPQSKQIGKQQYLLLGGWLDFGQANTVTNFVRDSIGQKNSPSPVMDDKRNPPFATRSLGANQQ